MSGTGSPWQPREQPEPKKAKHASLRQVPRKAIKRFDAQPATPAVPNPKNWDPELAEDQLDLFDGEAS